MHDRPGSVYKALETDKEFAGRVRAKYPWFESFYTGGGLDDQVWECFRMQRKIIERG